MKIPHPISDSWSDSTQMTLQTTTMLYQWFAVVHVVAGVLAVLGVYHLIKEARALRGGKGAQMARPFILLNLAVVIEVAVQLLRGYFRI